MPVSKAYALFRKDKTGGLHSMFVDAQRTIPMNMWIEASEGYRLPNGKVKSKLGGLSFRPGKHMASLPVATHIGVKRDGKIVCQHKDTVWCEVQYYTDIDYTPVIGKNGLPYVPRNGYYRFQTNTSAIVPWIIAGEYKIVKQLTHEQVSAICLQSGVTPQPAYFE